MGDDVGIVPYGVQCKTGGRADRVVRPYERNKKCGA